MSAERGQTRQGFKAIGVFTDRVAKPVLGRRGLAEGELVRQWSQIVGDYLARLSQPEAVRFPKGKRDGGELTIRAGSGAAATLLQHEAARVLERVNRYFGYVALNRLRILQAPLPQRRRSQAPKLAPLSQGEEQTLEEMLASVTDPDLRAALESLGRSMMGRKKAERSER